MLDKIVLSSDRKTATVITDDKTFTLYHSEGKVIDLVNELIIEPIERRERAEETTEVIEIQLTLNLEDVA